MAGFSALWRHCEYFRGSPYNDGERRTNDLVLILENLWQWRHRHYFAVLLGRWRCGGGSRWTLRLVNGAGDANIEDDHGTHR